MTRTEELAEKVRRFALLDMDRPGATPGNHRREAAAALSELVALAKCVGPLRALCDRYEADAEALAEALEPFTLPGLIPGLSGDDGEVGIHIHADVIIAARAALARYRGEKP